MALLGAVGSVEAVGTLPLAEGTIIARLTDTFPCLKGRACREEQSSPWNRNQRNFPGYTYTCAGSWPRRRRVDRPSRSCPRIFPPHRYSNQKLGHISHLGTFSDRVVHISDRTVQWGRGLWDTGPGNSDSRRLSGHIDDHHKNTSRFCWL